MDRWYYAQQKQKLGPVSRTQLQQLATSGQLLPSDMVLQEGTQKWARAGSIPHLFGNVPQRTNPVGAGSPTTKAQRSAILSQSKSKSGASGGPTTVIGLWPWAAGAATVLVCAVVVGIWLNSGSRQEEAEEETSHPIAKVNSPENKKDETGTSTSQGGNTSKSTNPKVLPPSGELTTESVERFVKDIAANPKTAEAKLKGKVVELSGVVSSAGPPYATSGLSFTVNNNTANEASIRCTVPPEQRQKAWLLAKGQKVKVVGVVTSIEKTQVTKDIGVLGVTMDECVVTELEPNPIPKLKAANLAATYEKNLKEAGNKYGDRNSSKELFLEGVVKSIQKEQNAIYLLLDAPGKFAVKVLVDKSDAGNARVGETVRFKAICRGLSARENAFDIWAWIIKGNPAGKKQITLP